MCADAPLPLTEIAQPRYPHLGYLQRSTCSKCNEQASLRGEGLVDHLPLLSGKYELGEKGKRPEINQERQQALNKWVFAFQNRVAADKMKQKHLSKYVFILFFSMWHGLCPSVRPQLWENLSSWSSVWSLASCGPCWDQSCLFCFSLYGQVVASKCILSLSFERSYDCI